jgi:hypothetical protein
MVACSPPKEACSWGSSLMPLASAGRFWPKKAWSCSGVALSWLGHGVDGGQVGPALGQRRVAHLRAHRRHQVAAGGRFAG